MLRFRTLGQVDLRGPDGLPVQELLTQPRRLGLLAYLAVARPRGLHRRDRLVTLFWPELDDTRARAALSQALHVIRKALGQGVLVTRGSEEVGVDFGRLLADADQFEQAADAGALSDADRLYQGDLLPGFHLDDAPEFEDWLAATRTRLRERAVALARDGAARAEAAGDVDAATAWLARLLEREPLDETALQRLVTLRAGAGDRAGALRAHEEFAARLRRELEVAPSPKTEALVARVRAERGASAPSAPREPPGVPAAPAPTAAPAPPDGPAPPPPARRASRIPRALVAGLILLLGAAIGFVTWRARRPAVAIERVAVLPFVVRGDTALGYLREGLVDLLATKLDALGAFETVDPAVALARVRGDGLTADTLADPARAARLAQELGAGHFVLGRLTATGGRIELAATLYDAAGARRAAITARAADARALPDAIDELARQLVATRWSAPADRLQRLAATSTTNPAALRRYLDGERAYRAGDYTAARDAFLDATGADSLFALAHYRLSVAAGWLADATHYVGSAERAWALADRLTPHDRALVEAHLAYIRGPNDDAERRYRELTRAYPDDAEAWYNLGEVLFHGNPYRGRPSLESAEPFRRAEALLGGSLDVRGHLLQLALLGGERATLVGSMDTLVAGYGPDEPRGRIYAVLRALALGDTAATLAAITRVPPGDLWVVGRSLATLTADFALADTAAGLLRSPARPAAERALGHVLRAEIRLARGQWRAARDEIDTLARLDAALAEQLDAYYVGLPWVPMSAEEVAREREHLAAWVPSPPPPPIPVLGSPRAEERAPMQLFYEGMLATRRGDTVEVAGIARRLERALADSIHAGPLGSLPFTLRAASRLANGNAAGALAALDSIPQLPALTPAQPQLSHALQRFLRAEALTALGRHDEALGYYGSFVVLFGYDLPFRGPGLLGEAEELEALGRHEEARQKYRAFLALWSASDPRFEPLLRRARNALATPAGR
ncbi:MAG: hypothetical protein IPK12_03425 [Gemmatimonadetes bacterium]|nr:hypothetical protein [Gemmatimonadota bacterium]